MTTAEPLNEKAYVNALKDFIKDYPELNRLLKFHEENKGNLLGLYLNMALGFLNSIPPLIASFDFSTFPIPSLLIHQGAIESLISNGICQARNDLTYNNGGITVKISDKERYLQIIQILSRVTDMEINNFKQLKVAYNIDNGWGGISSPYAVIFGNLPIKPSSIL
jgi:hypothetical protein